MTQSERIIANKTKLGKEDALAALQSARHLYVGRGKKLVYFDLEETPLEAEPLKHVLGPTGNLRAPSIRVGSTMLVGFNQEAYEKVFG